MGRTWKTVRLPSDLVDQVEELARAMERDHVAGRSTLPDPYVDHCPAHHVIARTGADFLAHRRRASRARRSPARTGQSGSPHQP